MKKRRFTEKKEYIFRVQSLSGICIDGDKCLRKQSWNTRSTGSRRDIIR